MAYVVSIIPKGFREGKKAQLLRCMKENYKIAEKNLDCAKEAKQKLDKELFERKNRLQRSIEAGKNLDTLA